MINKLDNYSCLSIEKIISTTTIAHPSKQGIFLNLTIFEDNRKHPYLLVFESDKASFSINTFDSYTYKQSRVIDVEIFLNTVIDKEGVIFEVFDLDYEPSKKMTKKEIEKELGYQIEIME